MPTTPFCFVCQKRQTPSGPPLQCCGSCRVSWYCSKECQKSDWRVHKSDCKVLADGASKSGTFRGPDIIHYVKFSKPHAKDIDLIGPFHPIEDAAPSIRERLEREKSPDGLKIFDFVLATSGIAGLRSHSAPLQDGKHLKITIENETHPEAAKLLSARGAGESADTWNLMTMRPNFAAFNDPKSHDHVLVDEQDIYKTYLNKDEANQAAKDLLEEWRQEFGEGTKVDCNVHTDDLLAGAVLPQKAIPRCVQVNHDATKRPTADEPVAA